MRAPPLAVLAGVVAVVVCAACTSSPNKVCAKLTELSAKKLAKSGLVTKEDRQNMEQSCVQELEHDKQESPERYDCVAKCVNASKDVDDLDPCLKKCPKPV